VANPAAGCSFIVAGRVGVVEEKIVAEEKKVAGAEVGLCTLESS
jgi:hypothetical protein